MSKLSETFIKNALARMKGKGLGQVDLARALGKSPNTINQYFGKRKTTPGLDVVEEWSRALDATPLWLLTDHSSATVDPAAAFPGMPPKVAELLRGYQSPNAWKALELILEASFQLGDARGLAKLQPLVETKKTKLP